MRALLEKSHAIDAEEERILMQALRVERIPLHEVRYQYAGVDRQLWICGSGEELYAPNAPWNRGRVIALVAGVVAAVVSLVAGVALLVLSR